MKAAKKWLKRVFIAFFFFVSFFLLADFYYFGYPTYVTHKAHDSVIVGSDVITLFDQQNVFLTLAMKGHFKILSVYKDKEECFSIKYVPEKSQAYIFSFDRKLNPLRWSGNMTDLNKFLKQNQKTIQACNNVCATFMPTYLYSGHFCVFYNEELKITSKEKPSFMD
jgi:hypothetical protein